MGTAGHVMRRKSTAHASARNVLVLLKEMGLWKKNRDVHINFPGGVPVDGPSAGVAMTVAAVSALKGVPVDASCAVTGEVSVQGKVLPVGGVPQKVEAAKKAGLQRVIVPRANYMERFESMGIQVIPVDTVQQAVEKMLLMALPETGEGESAPLSLPMAASGVR